MNQTRVAVFERMALVRAGVAQALAEQSIEVVAEGDLLDDSAVLFADVTVLDADLLPMGSASEVLRTLCGKTNVILLMLAGDAEQARAAIAAGVRGCVLKGGERHELVDAVRAAHRNEGYVAPSLAALMIRNQLSTKTGAAAKLVSQLTFREGQIFDLLSKGMKNKEIGARLNLSEKSIKRYVTCIFEKLNVRNRVEAALLFREKSPGDRTNVNLPPSRSAAWPAPTVLSPSGSGLLAATCTNSTSYAAAGFERTSTCASGLATATGYFHEIFSQTPLSYNGSSGEIELGSQSAGKHIVL